MRTSWSRLAINVVAAVLLGPAAPLQAQPMQYHGGPILRTFTIYPLYYGNWSNADITAHQNFLVGLAGYLSGHNNPAGQQTMLWQYGVNEATVAAAATDGAQAAPAKLSRSDLLNIIQANQGRGNLPAFGPATLIMVFPVHGFGLTDCNGCGYHSSESTSAFWSVVPQDAGVGKPVAGPVPASPAPFQLVTSHEIFEASANPSDDQSQGWDEMVDGCPDGEAPFGGSWIGLPFGWIAGVHDNTQNGNCSTTGYTSTDEIQVYGWTYADYRTKYDELWPQGWRLYILQSYAMPNGQVLYDAVWRPGTGDEIQVYGWSFDDYKKEYDELWPQGWRLYILQSYVTSSCQVLYNAVWRRGNLGEIQNYDSSYGQYRSTYDQLWPQGWRLQTLQSYVTGLPLPFGGCLSQTTSYNAVWRPGDSGELQVYGWTYPDYRTTYDELWPQGWRLYILQSYVMNDQVLYNAAWRPGNMPEIQVYSYTYADYRKKYDELWSAGWRLYVLDAFVIGGQVRYNAVWRIGTSDRPL
jgi:hypothetical protein